MFTRRRFVSTLITGSALSACSRFDGQWLYPCKAEGLPLELSQHERVQALCNGIDFNQVWDSHVHLLGLGDSPSNIYINPGMQSWLHPVLRLQFHFYMNAACANDNKTVDESVIAAMQQRATELPSGMKAMLLAFDAWHNVDGTMDKSATSFYVPNDYAARCAQLLPDRFEWVASIHPYRPDAVEQLNDCVNRGARAVKWLPPAMGIDPASSRCDAFYDALNKLDIPLISHAGTEHAAPGKIIQEYGNPLLLRRALERGVRVIVAHCASLGRGMDLDSNSQREEAHYDFFARMMENKDWQGRLFGDLSAIALVNREDNILPDLLTHESWHSRLLQASDYPLPAVMPIISLRGLVKNKVLSENDANLLMQIRQHNALLFDFLLKRALSWQGQQFAASVFHTRRHFNRIRAA